MGLNLEVYLLIVKTILYKNKKTLSPEKLEPEKNFDQNEQSDFYIYHLFWKLHRGTSGAIVGW